MKAFIVFAFVFMPSICFSQTIGKKVSPKGEKALAIMKQAYKKYDEQDYSTTIDLTTQLIKMNPDDYFAYLLRGQAEYFSNDRDSAIQDVNRSIELNPHFSDGYSWRGIMEPNDPLKAFDDFSFAIKYSYNKNELSECYYNRANVRAEQLDWRGAISDCNQSILYNPDNFNAYSTRAQGEIETEDYYSAIRDCDKAISFSPGADWFPYYYRGLAKIKLGKTESACEDFNEAKQIDQKSNEVDYRITSAISKYCN